jgi:hypothetical protein
VIQRGTDRRAQAVPPPRSTLPTVIGAEREARYAGIAEPLRSRLIALIEDRERQQRGQVLQPREGERN